MIKIIRPAGQVQPTALAVNVSRLRNLGWKVDFDQRTIAPDSWPFTAGTIAERSYELNQALLDPEVSIIWCARGGYGMSDLLPLIPWEKLKALSPKRVIGFSDICALQSALWTQLSWPSLHAPMPGSDLWPQTDEATLELVSTCTDQIPQGQIPLISIPPKRDASVVIQGPLFGGCLSVLSNLIGTPYAPKTLAGRILFFEDVQENPGRIIRNFNQWKQAGLLEGVRAIILGAFSKCGFDAESADKLFWQPLSERLEIPLFSCGCIGHIAKNYPIAVGGTGVIHGNELHWSQNESLKV